MRLVLHRSRVGDVNVSITSEVAIMSNKEDVICDQMTDLGKTGCRVYIISIENKDEKKV